MAFISDCILLSCFTIVIGCQSTEGPNVPLESTTIDSSATEVALLKESFDPERAAQFGADDYGMKQYVMAFLYAGPNSDRSEQESIELQAAHMANISRLSKEGPLILAGPFLDEGDLRGIYIFNVSTVEEARSLTETDPAIKAGSLVMELKPWYGSAALMGVNDEHMRVAKVKF